jgi:asparagine synthase (glutamine-hydrolysing)
MIKRINKILKEVVNIYQEKALLSKLSRVNQNLIAEIRDKKLTYLTNKKLVNITTTCNLINEKNIPGIFIEAGCALGGSSILISKLKDNQRPFFIYDVFGIIPPPTQDDTKDVHDRYKTITEGKSKGIKGNKYYGYEDNLYEIVKTNLQNFNIDRKSESIFLIKGLLQDTMKIEEKVAFAHIDVDWYEPVITCLERIFPNLAIGGSIILDDYHDWGGCRKATDEFLTKVSGKFILDDSFGSMKITKIKE